MYVLGGREFLTKAAIVAECRRILKETKANTKIEGADEAFVRDLLKLHPRRGSTAAVERELYVVWSQRSSRDKCFAYWSNRKGEPIDFSYKECINPKPPIDRFSQAAREAICADIIVFKQAFWRGKRSARCPITGELMHCSSSHVDHAYVCFAALVDRFIEAHSIDLSSVTYRGNGWANAALVEAFVDFHRANATLAVISAQANLSKGSSGYKRSKPTAPNAA